MVGEACLPSNAYYPRTPDYTLCSGVHVCWSEHSDSSFVYGFMILNYGFGTMTATTLEGTFLTSLNKKRNGVSKCTSVSIRNNQTQCKYFNLKLTDALSLSLSLSLNAQFLIYRS